MNFDEMANKCRAAAHIIPELGEPLRALADRFVKEAVKARQPDSPTLGLQQRRIRVALWPEIAYQLDSYTRRRQFGLSIDLPALDAALGNFIATFDAAYVDADPSGAGGSWTHRLRQTAALTRNHNVTPIAAKPWMQKLDRHNPLTWRKRRLKQVQRSIAKSRKNACRTLDEVLLGNFLSKSLGMDGQLQTFLDYASHQRGAWGWVGDKGIRRSHQSHIAEVIWDLDEIADPVLTLMWMYPSIWRDLPHADDAAEALIDAILACCATIRHLSREVVIFAEESSSFVEMDQARDRAREKAHELMEVVEATFPDKVKVEPYRRKNAFCMRVTVSLDLWFERVYIDRISIWRGVIDLFDFKPYKEFREPYFFKRNFAWYRDRNASVFAAAEPFGAPGFITTSTVDRKDRGITPRSAIRT